MSFEDPKRKNRKFSGVRYNFRASYYPHSVKTSVENMRKNGWLVRTIKRKSGFIDVYTLRKKQKTIKKPVKKKPKRKKAVLAKLSGYDLINISKNIDTQLRIIRVNNQASKEFPAWSKDQKKALKILRKNFAIYKNDALKNYKSKGFTVKNLIKEADDGFYDFAKYKLEPKKPYNF